MSCKVHTKDGKESKLFPQLVKLYNESNLVNLSTNNMSDLIDYGLTSAIVYSELRSEKFKKFFGNWESESFDANENFTNEVGEPKLYKIGSRVYIRNKKGQRWVLPNPDYGYLNSVEIEQLINFISNKIIEEVGFGSLVSNNINPALVKSFIKDIAGKIDESTFEGDFLKSSLTDYSDFLANDVIAYFNERGVKFSDHDNSLNEDEENSKDPLNIMPSEKVNPRVSSNPYIKLMLSTIVPKKDRNGKILTSETFGEDVVIYESFDKVWSLLQPHLANITQKKNKEGKLIDPIDEYISEIKKLELVAPGLKFLRNKLELAKQDGSKDAALLNQFYATFNLSSKQYYRATFVANNIFDEKTFSSDVIFYDANQSSPSKKLLNTWSANLYSPEVNFYKESDGYKINKEKRSELVSKLRDLEFTKKNYKENLSLVKDMLKDYLGIDILPGVLEYSSLYGNQFKNSKIPNHRKIYGFVARLASELSESQKLLPFSAINHKTKTFKNVFFASRLNALNQLAETQSMFDQGTTEDNMVYSKEAYYRYSYPSMVSNLVNQFNQGDLSHLEELQEQTYYAQTDLIKDIQENPLEFSIIDFLSAMAEGRVENSVDNSSIEFADHYKINLNNIFLPKINKKENLQKYRYTAAMPINADKSQYKYLKGMKYQEYEFVELDGKIILDENTQDLFYGYFLDELRRIQEVLNGKNANVEYYGINSKLKNGLKSQIFPSLSYDVISSDTNNELVEGGLYKYNEKLELIGLADFKEINKEVFANELSGRIQSLLNKEIEIALEAKAIIYDENGDLKFHGIPKSLKEIYTTIEKGAEVEDVKGLLFTKLINEIKSNIEIGRVFHGDPAYYKNLPDLIKRHPGAHSDGLYMRLKEGDPVNFKAAVVDDVVVKKNIFTDEDLDALVEYYTNKDNFDREDQALSKDEVKKIISPLKNKGIDITDAQGWATIDRWKFITQRISRWTDIHESAYQKIKNDSKEPLTPDELKVSLQPLKMVHFSIKNGKPTYLKYSLFVLNPQVVKGTAMNDVYKSMQEKGVDELIVKAGVKVGAQDLTTIHDESGKVLSDLNLIPFELDNRYSKLQQQLPTKGIKTDSIKTQVTKNLLESLTMTKPVYTYKGKKVTGQKINDEIKKEVEKIINDQTDAFEKKFIDENGLFDRSSFDKLVLDQLKDSASNISEAIVQGLPYNALPQFKSKIQSVIYSQIKKASLNINSQVSSVIQVAGFGLSEITDYNNSDIIFTVSEEEINEGLKPAKFDKDEVKPAMILMPHSYMAKFIPNYHLLDKEKIMEIINNSPALLEAIGYRVPNQGMSSNSSLKIAGILPPYMGDSAIMFDGVTTITGSDYDIDKLYVIHKKIEPQYKDFNKKIDSFVNSKEGKSFSEVFLAENEEGIKENKKIINSLLATNIGRFESLSKFVKQKTTQDLLEDFYDNFPSEATRYLLDLKISLEEHFSNETPEAFIEVESSENNLFELYDSILKSPNTYLSSIRSIDAEDIKNHINEIAPDPGSSDLEFFSGSYQLEKKVSLQKGKQGVGQDANQLVDVAFSQVAKLGYIDRMFLFGDYVHRSEEDSKVINLGREDTLSDDRMNVSWALSAFLNAFVDIAKDDYVLRGNYFTMVNSAAFPLIRAGMDYKLVNSLVTSPVIREYVKLENERNNVSHVEFNKIKNPYERLSEEYGKAPVDESIFNKYRNKSKLIKVLQNENASREDKALILKSFQDAIVFGRSITAQTGATRFDSNPSKNSYERLMMKNAVVKAMNSKVLINFEDKITKTFLKAYFDNGILRPDKYMGNLFWEDTREGSQLINSLSYIYTGNPLENDQLAKTLRKALDGLSMQTPFVLDFSIEKLIDAENGIWNTIKKRFPELISTNLLVNKLRAVPVSYGGSKYTFLEIDSTGFTKTDKDNVIKAWSDLYKEYPRLAASLYAYTYYTNLSENNFKSLTEFVPTDILINAVKEDGDIYSEVDFINDNISRMMMSREHVSDIIAQNFFDEDNRIVRKIPSKVTQSIGKGKDIISVNPKSLNNFYSKTKDGLSYVQPYIKLEKTVGDAFESTKMTDIYKLMGYVTDESGDYKFIYSRFPKSSTSLSQKLKVYNFTGEQSPLIHPDVRKRNEEAFANIKNKLKEYSENNPEFNLIERSPLNNEGNTLSDFDFLDKLMVNSYKQAEVKELSEEAEDQSFEEASEQIVDVAEVKPEVSELFESNPELANEVYEALGFKEKQYASKLKDIIERRKLATKSDLENSQLIKDIRVDKTQSKDIKPNTADKNLASIMLYGHRYSDLSNMDYVDNNLSTITNPAEMKMEAETLAYRILNNLLFDIKEINEFYEEIKEKPEYANALTTNENPVKEFFENDIFNQVEKENLEITPQQKQQAQQQYSQYLDTIFPDSKVKDIVYHGSDKSFEEFKIPEKYGAWFSSKPGVARKQAELLTGKNKEGLIKYSVLLDIQNPKKGTPEGFDASPSTYLKGFDSMLFSNRYENEVLVVKNAKQIHILGSKQDIQGFKKFVGQGLGSGSIVVINNETINLNDFESISINDKKLSSIIDKSNFEAMSREEKINFINCNL